MFRHLSGHPQAVKTHYN